MSTTSTTTQMTSLLNTLANTDMVIKALAEKYNLDFTEARKTALAAFAHALQSELPMDAKTAVAETSGLAATKPKRTPAAFDLWAKDARAEIKTGMPEGTKSAEVTKALRKAWKTVTDEVKAPFNDEAKALRAAAKPISTKMTKKEKKAAKDPNAPKRPTNAYMRYAADVRVEVRAAQPEGTQMSEVAKVIGAQWKELSADDKAPYEQAAQDDKVRYAEAKAEYDAQKQATAEIATPDRTDTLAEEDTQAEIVAEAQAIYA